MTLWKDKIVVVDATNLQTLFPNVGFKKYDGKMWEYIIQDVLNDAEICANEIGYELLCWNFSLFDHVNWKVKLTFKKRDY
ncbi:ATP-binding cassette domain-containing protein [Aeromonas phage ZPAH1]|nr:ATP-binding cassette domain-containing protein [Aeromonas phage ZPAH1]